VTQIIVNLNKETPFETLNEVASFILHMAAVVHGKMPAAAIQSEPTYVNNVLPFPQAKVEDEEDEAPETFTAHDLEEVDTDGYPWDARIHAKGKSKASNGKWRARRNAKPHVVAQVHAELRNKMAAKAELIVQALPVVPLPPVPTPALPPLQVPPPPPVAAAATEPAIIKLPEPEPLPPVETPSIPAEPDGRSFDELMALVTDVLVAETLTEDDIYLVLRQFNVKELADLAGATPQSVASVYKAIKGAVK
jgi:hypothetical protein